MKSFTTASKAPVEDGEEQVSGPVTVELDKRKLTFRGPTSKTLLMLMSIYAELESGNRLYALGSQINMIFNLLNDDDKAYMRRRMFDVNDPFGEDELVGIFGHLIEEWSGRPTELPSGSASPPSSTGGDSTVMPSGAV